MQCNVAYYDNKYGNNSTNSKSNNYNHSYSNVNNRVDPSYPQLCRLPTAWLCICCSLALGCAQSMQPPLLPHICIFAKLQQQEEDAAAAAATTKSHYLVDTPTKNGQQPENVAMLQVCLNVKGGTCVKCGKWHVACGLWHAATSRSSGVYTHHKSYARHMR